MKSTRTESDRELPRPIRLWPPPRVTAGEVP